MNIEIWSDFVCPFCYIGKKKIEEALASFPHKDQVNIIFKSYELDPNAKLYDGTSFYEGFAKKFNISIEQAQQMAKGVAQQASEAGLTFNFDHMKPTNTFDAHRLTKLAKSLGKEVIVNEKLFLAHFTNSEDIGKQETLIQIAVEAGLEHDTVVELLNDQTMHSESVRSDEAEARQLGISGVPYFVFNQKYAISGAQPVDSFIKALNKVWEEENRATKIEDLSLNNESNGIICTDDGCEL